MKSILFTTLLLLQFAAVAQTYVPLKIVKGIATFEATAEPQRALTDEEIHARTEKWLEEAFLSQSVITQNIPERISARFFQDYSDGTWSDQFEHNLQIDIRDGKAVFTITDTKLGLVRDGAWKEHLAKIRVMFEKAANELFWSFSDSLNAAESNK